MVSSEAVLFVADLLHPLHDLAVERLLNGDMGHRRGRRRAMPMLLTPGGNQTTSPGWTSSIGTRPLAAPSRSRP